MTRPVPVRQRGFTLIELIIFIVVISAGLAGILSVMNTVVKSSADPMVRKQAMALAESVLEEVMLHNFNDPDGTSTGETGRSNWDNVDDFDAINEVVSASGPVFTGLPVGVYGYTIKVDVDPATLGVLAAKTVTVTVSRGAESISLIGYRACYGEAACPL